MDILYYTRNILISIIEIERSKENIVEKINEIRYRKANQIKKKAFCVILYLFTYGTIDRIGSMNGMIRHYKAQGRFFGPIEAVINFFMEMFIIVIIFSLILYLVKKIIYYIASKHDLSEEDESIINTFRNDIKNLDLKKENFLYHLSKSSIPRDYRNINALNFMIKAYENKQGDTFKELVNLYRYNATVNNIKAEMERNKELYESEVNNIKKDVEKVKRHSKKNKSSIELLKIYRLFK